MALFGLIRDGVLEDVGQLPPSARRLDTGQIVHDLNGIGRRWARACGWYDLTDPADLLLIPPDVRVVLQPAITAELDRQQARRDFVRDAKQTSDIARDLFWDWLDKYSGVPIPGSPNAGQDWGGLSSFDKAEALRVGLSQSLFFGIRVAETLLLMIRVLSGLIELEGGDPADLAAEGVE